MCQFISIPIFYWDVLNISIKSMEIPTQISINLPSWNKINGRSKLRKIKLLGPCAVPSTQPMKRSGTPVSPMARMMGNSRARVTTSWGSGGGRGWRSGRSKNLINQILQLTSWRNMKSISSICLGGFGSFWRNLMLMDVAAILKALPGTQPASQRLSSSGRIWCTACKELLGQDEVLAQQLNHFNLKNWRAWLTRIVDSVYLSKLYIVDSKIQNYVPLFSLHSRIVPTRKKWRLFPPRSTGSASHNTKTSPPSALGFRMPKKQHTAPMKSNIISAGRPWGTNLGLMQWYS